jgi:hypothetical protein
MAKEWSAWWRKREHLSIPENRPHFGGACMMSACEQKKQATAPKNIHCWSLSPSGKNWNRLLNNDGIGPVRFFAVFSGTMFALCDPSNMARSSIPKGLHHLAQSWPDSKRAYLGSLPQGFSTLKGLNRNHL